MNTTKTKQLSHGDYNISYTYLLLGKGKAKANIIGEIVKELTLLSPEGIKKVAEAVERGLEGYGFAKIEDFERVEE